MGEDRVLPKTGSCQGILRSSSSMRALADRAWAAATNASAASFARTRATRRRKKSRIPVRRLDEGGVFGDVVADEDGIPGWVEVLDQRGQAERVAFGGRP